MTSFTKTALAGDRYLVEGTDTRGKSGEVVVDGSQFNLYRKRSAVEDAQAAFDKELERFYAPVLAATKRVEEAAGGYKDPLMYLVEPKAGTAGSRGRDGIVATHDTRILLAIESGDTSRLIWVGDYLEITEAQVATVTAPTTATPDPAVFDDAADEQQG